MIQNKELDRLSGSIDDYLEEVIEEVPEGYSLIVSQLIFPTLVDYEFVCITSRKLSPEAEAKIRQISNKGKKRFGLLIDVEEFVS